MSATFRSLRLPNLPALIPPLGSAVSRHFRRLHVQSDPIQTIAAFPDYIHSFRADNLAALAISTLVTLYGVVGLPFDHTGSVWWTFTHWSTNPHVFPHRIMPATVWPQFDRVLAIAAVTLVVGAAVLAAATPIRPQCRLWIRPKDPGSKVILLGPAGVPLDGPESARVLRARTVLRRAHATICVATLVLGNGMFGLNAAQNTSGEERETETSGSERESVAATVRCALYWGVAFPAFPVYLTYYNLILTAPATGAYLRIRLQWLNRKLSTLIRKLSRPSTRWNPGTGRYYTALNRESAALCLAIHEYSRSASRILLVQLPTYITVQCYLSYVLLFTPALPPSVRHVFRFGVLEMNGFLWAVTRACAAVGGENRRQERLHRTVYVRLFLPNHYHHNQQQPEVVKHRALREMIKAAEVYAVQRRFHRYCFRIGSFLRLTAGTYYVLLGYQMAFFMFLVKQRGRK